ncbi:glycosyltransferase family 4 protein [Chloroflexota bacterium]
MRILVCTPKIPWPLDSGDTLRIYNIFKQLSKRHSVYLVYFENNDESKYLKIVKESGIFVECISLGITHSLASRAIGMLFPHTRMGYLKLRALVSRKVAHIIREKGIEVIHAHGALRSLLLTDIKDTPSVLDMTDAMSLYYHRQRMVSRSQFKRLTHYFRLVAFKRIERYLLSNFPVTTVVSPVDKEYLNRLVKMADVKVIPNGVDINYFTIRTGIEEDYPSILYSGNMNFPPNVSAVLYLNREILPLIRVAIPEVKFYIVGANPHPDIKILGQDEHIIVTGFVADIREYILKGSVVLTPMISGSGQKNKILEAMALGKPVITNPMGIEWMDHKGRNCVAIGDTNREIADKVLELLSDKNARFSLGESGRLFVKRHYTWEITAREYENLYQELIKDHNVLVNE